MKCPKCGNEMMILCRRDSSGFLNEVYYRCLACSYIPREEEYALKTKTAQKKLRIQPKLGIVNWRWQIPTATVLAALVLVSVMQIPVPVRVFATETSIDPFKDILPYVDLINFTMSQFSLNYSEGQITLNITADYARVTSTETTQNVTICNVLLGKVLINYRDETRELNMGFASLSLAVTIKYQELIAKIDATVYMPLWTATINQLAGRTF
ncbi:MAG: hypothetical protein OEY95_03595 [Candidatus Bathyarchaeota archaeon]|nr:hypothetical protein [Candidatus Bathyarchaeota archaeon]